MNDSKLRSFMTLFLSALHAEMETLETHLFGYMTVPLDQQAFAAVAEGDEFAGNLLIVTTGVGKICPEFRRGLVIAYSVGQIARLSSDFRLYKLNLTACQANEQRDAQNYDLARAFARKYLVAVRMAPTAY